MLGAFLCVLNQPSLTLSIMYLHSDKKIYKPPFGLRKGSVTEKQKFASLCIRPWIERHLSLSRNYQINRMLKSDLIRI